MKLSLSDSINACVDWRRELRSRPGLLIAAIALCWGVLLVALPRAHVVFEGQDARQRPDEWTVGHTDSDSGDSLDDDDDGDSNDDAPGALLAAGTPGLTPDRGYTLLVTGSGSNQPRTHQRDGHALRGPPTSDRYHFVYTLHRDHPVAIGNVPAWTEKSEHAARPSSDNAQNLDDNPSHDSESVVLRARAAGPLTGIGQARSPIHLDVDRRFSFASDGHGLRAPP
jgi:hypothetical protein